MIARSHKKNGSLAKRSTPSTWITRDRSPGRGNALPALAQRDQGEGTRYRQVTLT